MKKCLVVLLVLGSLFFFTSCATLGPVGGLYTSVTLPVHATSNASFKSLKVGKAECTSILGLIATGDASIDTAKKNGNISKVHHVDWNASNFLGIYGKYTVTVYGE